MNPFFWFLVVVVMVVLWFTLRGIFIFVGGKAQNLIDDTKRILADEDRREDETKNNGGNKQ